jgi:COP9 signalosome complex subunit 3
MQERTLGLITQALNRAPRWAIKKLTTTYLTLHLSDIGRQVGISDETEVKSLILSMVTHFIPS